MRWAINGQCNLHRTTEKQKAHFFNGLYATSFIVGSDQAMLLILKCYRSEITHFEALNRHFHAPKWP
jgi:hypothetical protein